MLQEKGCNVVLSSAVYENRASHEGRGAALSRWPVLRFVSLCSYVYVLDVDL